LLAHKLPSKDTILEECERVVEQYWNLKDETKNADFQSLSKKIKRSPYNQLLMKKFHLIMDLNDRRFCQQFIYECTNYP